MASSRLVLIKIHMLLAAFMFPAALMFLLTGGLYTWSIKGSYESVSEPVTLTAPLQQDEAVLADIVKQELGQRGIDYPSGKAKIKQGGLSYKYEWTGSRRDVVLEPTEDPRVATLTIKETTWYRNLVQLHKAKGGQLFKVYAAALAVSLFAILLSGFIVAWQIPRYRGQAIAATLAGIGCFLLAVLLS